MDQFTLDSLTAYAIKQDLLILRLTENLLELDKLIRKAIAIEII